MIKWMALLLCFGFRVHTDLTWHESFDITLLVWLSWGLNKLGQFGPNDSYGNCEIGCNNRMQHQMRFDSANLFLRSCSWALMNCYDYSISQNIHIFCYYNYKAHVSQTVSHPSFRLTQTCVQPHTRTHTHTNIKQSRVYGEVRSVYLLSSFLCVCECVWVALRCLFIVLLVINSSPLSPCCWLGLSCTEREAEWKREAQVEGVEKCRKRDRARKKEEWEK